MCGVHVQRKYCMFDLCTLWGLNQSYVIIIELSFSRIWCQPSWRRLGAVVPAKIPSGEPCAQPEAYIRTFAVSGRCYAPLCT